MKTTKLGPFLGTNNRLPPFSLATKEGYFLADAENVDITNAGNIVRRSATELVQAMVGAHSLFMVSDTAGYLVRGSALYSFVLGPYSETLVRTLTTNDAMSYVAFNGSLFFSNGTDSGRVTGGTAYPLGLPTPNQPALAAAGGTLSAGWYQVAVSYTNSVTGEEGGISASSNIEVGASAGIVVTLPGVSSGATHVNIYVSTVNGSVPMLHSTVTMGTASITVTTPGTGREINPRFEQPLPAGKLFMFNGMLCSYKGGEVYRGLPFRHGYCRSTEARIPFPATVSNVVPNQNGIYITADQTYWFAGQDLADVQMIQDVLPYGAVPGTAFKVPNKPLVGWFGDKGFVIADANGQVEEACADQVDVTVPETGCATVLSDRGYRRVISCGYCMNLENRAVTRYDANYLLFNSLSKNYGLHSDGLRKLSGTGQVAATISFGQTNFGVEERKRMPAAYLGCTSESQMKLRITTPEHDYTYDARTSSEDLRIQRVDPGKGLIANWFGLTVSNTDGADFELASVSFAPIASQRRI